MHCDPLPVDWLTQSARKNGGERLMKKIDNCTLWMNVNTYGMPMAMSSKTCQRTMYSFG